MFRLAVILSLVALATCDLPINCMYNDVLGSWEIQEGVRTGDANLECGEVGEVAYNKVFTFTYPNIVEDEQGNFGTWTLVYNQGFEFTINQRAYWSPFNYDLEAGTYSCDSLYFGWSRDVTARNFACYTGQRMTGKKEREVKKFVKPIVLKPDEQYVEEQEFVNKINAIQRSWTAKVYPQHEKYTNKEMFLRGGGKNLVAPQTRPATEEEKTRASLLPESFDWTNVDGVNYVSSVKDQESCGSCYAFTSTAVAEARVRIATQMERQDEFSPQEIVGCSKISEGCDGGFTYLTAGRYGMDKGFVDVSCNEYEGVTGTCDTDQSCPRTYVSGYKYLGGYYGGCNEQVMMEALITNGPMGIGFNVESDFYNYAGGVYHYTGLQREFNPFLPTNHAVTLVGYGVDEETGEKFWKAKNSWGRFWGENGFFRIRRGTNEVAFESMVADINVIP